MSILSEKATLLVSFFLPLFSIEKNKNEGGGGFIYFPVKK